MAERLLERFTLTQSEHDAIYAHEATIDQTFLRALDRLQTIQDESLLLMDASEPDDDTPAGQLPLSARAARDIRERTTAQLQTAMQRLAHWCSSVLRSLPLEGADVTVWHREALRRLAAREDLFHPTMAAFAETRAARWPEAFTIALVVGGPPPSYLPRPIELYAHDAVRYVSDMLAWVHQAIASERELVTSLFALLAVPSDSPSFVADAHGVEQSVLEGLIHRVLDRSLAGCCRPLRKRVQQTIAEQTNAALILKLYFVLSFYRATMHHTLRDASPLFKTVDELYHMADVAFVHALQQRQRMLAVPDEPSQDVPPAFTETLAHLRALLGACTETRDASPLYTRIAQHLVDPMHTMCTKTADKIRHGPTQAATPWLSFSLFGTRAEPRSDPEWDANVFLVHALAPFAHVLAEHAELRNRYEHARHDCIRAAQRLCDMHYADMYKASGLTVLESDRADEQAFLPVWNAFCASPGLLFPPKRLACVKDGSLQNAVHRAALLHLVQTYTQRRAAFSSLPSERDVAMVMDVLDVMDEAPGMLVANALFPPHMEVPK